MTRPQFRKYETVEKTGLEPGASIDFTLPEFRGILKAMSISMTGDATADGTGETVTLEKMMDTVLVTVSMKNGGTLMKDEIGTMLYRFATHPLGGPHPVLLPTGGASSTSSWTQMVPVLFSLHPNKITEFMGLDRALYEDLTVTVTLPTSLAHVVLDAASLTCKILLQVVENAIPEGYITYEGHHKTFTDTDPFELRPTLKAVGGVINKVGLYGDNGSTGHVLTDIEIWEGTDITFVTSIGREQAENIIKYRMAYHSALAMTDLAYTTSPVHPFYAILDFDQEDDIYGSMLVKGLMIKAAVAATERLDYQYIVYVPYVEGEGAR